MRWNLRERVQRVHRRLRWLLVLRGGLHRLLQLHRRVLLLHGLRRLRWLRWILYWWLLRMYGLQCRLQWLLWRVFRIVFEWMHYRLQQGLWHGLRWRVQKLLRRVLRLWIRLLKWLQGV